EVTPDGRYVLAAVGTERLRVTSWLPDDPYPLADVDVWPDEGELGDVPAERIEGLHHRVRELNEIVLSLGELVPPPDAEISDDPWLAVYHLASLSPLGPADRQRILAARGLVERVQQLEEALDDAAAVLNFRRS
ncbi:MAG TPA: LON peptidase substrate-binding domain-containing protein, partial [Ilumatobacter sp.]|nr:LON peptidase substrate-binding domain-containing protein [Ilumatobacter sp.]